VMRETPRDGQLKSIISALRRGRFKVVGCRAAADVSLRDAFTPG
jgi:hypothetical protein